jgi:isoaspartyl peptidase/L-asparaginase-like protein (Ntn-hydrolase superfamily)
VAETSRKNPVILLLFGSGFYADNRGGAACTTGNGEDIMRICLSKAAVDPMKKGINAQRAASISIELLTNEPGAETGGIITVDRTGLVGYASNTKNMPITKMQIGMEKPFLAGF